MSSSPTKSHQPSSSISTIQAAESSSNRLSPFKNTRDRPASRSSSRTSLRTHSPSFSLEDPVSVRNHMSTLKHNIRQQQAQLNNLESIVRSGPRPYGPNLFEDPSAMASTSSSSSIPSTGIPPPPSSYVPTSPQSSSAKMKRRSSHDVLLSLAGPESNLPLPRRDTDEQLQNGNGNGNSNGIREGIPSTFPASPTSFKRPPSPTRTLSRIPVSAVGNARALADEGAGTTPRKLSPFDPSDPSTSSSSLQPPASPNRRLSLTPGGTTKVLADLQTGVVNARNALENTKTQLRLSQRSVAQLTRQTEDLKEGRERLRLENEGLNNVVARKERLLQEVLERARKAEAEAATLKAQLKSETTSSKKTIRELESSLSLSSSLSLKSEREYLVLRDTLKSMAEGWKLETEALKADMAKREAKCVEDAQRVGKMYRDLVDKVRKGREGEEEVRVLREEEGRRQKEVEEYWVGRVEEMKREVEREGREEEEANKTAKHLAEELARLRRLMRSTGRTSGDDHDTDTNSASANASASAPEAPNSNPPP